MGVCTDGTTAKDTVFYAKANADGTLGTWSSDADIVPDDSYGMGIAIANGYMYSVGGGDADVAINVSYFSKINSDGSIGAWTEDTSSDLNTARYLHSLAVANGYLYAIGGANGVDGATSYSSIEYAKLNADGTLGAWTTASTSLLAPRYFNGGTPVYNGYIYTIAGINGDYGVDGNYYNTSYVTSTQRIKFGGSLDLTSYSGGDNAEGNGSGGSLTAGNTNIVGLLQVAGAANFAQGASIGGELNVTGNVSLGTGLVVSKVANGASAVGFTLTTQSMTTAGAKLFVLNNATNERFSVDKDGHIVTYGHLKSTQTTAPTIGTPANCGTSPSSAVTANSTDTAGSITINTGTGSPTTCDTVVTFNRAYGTAPKAIIISGKNANTELSDVYVSATATTTFTIAAPAASVSPSDTWEIYYWVVE